jgi:hypothetical protein
MVYWIGLCSCWWCLTATRTNITLYTFYHYRAHRLAQLVKKRFPSYGTQKYICCFQKNLPRGLLWHFVSCCFPLRGSILYPPHDPPAVVGPTTSYPLILAIRDCLLTHSHLPSISGETPLTRNHVLSNFYSSSYVTTCAQIGNNPKETVECML